MDQKYLHTLKILSIGCVLVAILLAGMGLFYYYAIFTPNLEREKFNFEKVQLEQKRQDELAEKKKEEQRLNMEKQKAEHEKKMRSIAYDNCINESELIYSQNWANNCKKIADKNKASLRQCLNDESIMSNQYLGRSFCLKSYGATEFDENCSLPRVTAQDLEDFRKERKDNCLKQARNELMQLNTFTQDLSENPEI